MVFRHFDLCLKGIGLRYKAPLVCMSVPCIAQTLFVRLTSNLEGVLLITRGCACIHVYMYICILCLLSQWAKTRTSPLCYCNPHSGRKLDCIRTVSLCKRLRSAGLYNAVMTDRREDISPCFFTTFAILLYQNTRERASELRAFLKHNINKIVTANNRVSICSVCPHRCCIAQLISRVNETVLVKRGSGGQAEWQKQQCCFLIVSRQIKSLCFNTVETDTLFQF